MLHVFVVNPESLSMDQMCIFTSILENHNQNFQNLNISCEIFVKPEKKKTNYRYKGGRFPVTKK